MPTTEKFCLRWNDFQENINTTFKNLRKDNDFTDVTLACEDGYEVEAHKLILAASSPFFHNLLKTNKHAHPLIYMRRMKSEDLLAIVDFLYYGEANIYQDNLDTFLNIAEELKLKGLKGTEAGGGEEGGTVKRSQNQTYNHNYQSVSAQRKNETTETSVSQPNESVLSQYCSSSMAIVLPKHEVSGDMKELDQQIETMMSRSENMVSVGNQKRKAFICKVCGKEGQQINIKDHIEANHLEGISVPCSICEKNFRSRRALRHHMKTPNSCNN